MKQALPPLTTDLIEAFVASAVAWVMRLMGVALDPKAHRRRRRLLALVRHIERCIEHIFFLKAVHAFGPPPKRRRTPNASQPPGFRRSRGNLRLFWKIAHIRADRRASLVARLAQLLHALAHPARYIARFTKRLCNGLTLSHLTLIAPPAHALLAANAPTAITFEDTS